MPHNQPDYPSLNCKPGCIKVVDTFRPACAGRPGFGSPLEAGSDWRSLAKLAIEDGQLRDFALIPEEWRSSVLGVRGWDEGYVRTRAIAGGRCM